MATEYYIFRGKAVYPFLTKTDKNLMGEEFYKIGLAMDKPSWELFKRSGIKLKPKSLDHLSSDLNPFVTFRRPTRKLIRGEMREFGPPKLEGWDAENILLGNGSEVEVTVSVYDTRFGKGHRLEAVKALKVVPYEEKPVTVKPNVKVYRPEDIEDSGNNEEKLNDSIPF